MFRALVLRHSPWRWRDNARNVSRLSPDTQLGLLNAVMSVEMLHSIYNSTSGQQALWYYNGWLLEAWLTPITG